MAKTSPLSFAAPITSVAILAIFCYPALADDCDAVLDSKLMSTSNIVDFNSASEAFKQSFCLKTLSQAQQANASGGGASYEGIGAEFTQSASSFNSWKHSNCGESDSEQQTQSFYMSAQKAMNADVVKEWRACKTNSSGLSCYVRPEVDGEYALTLSWKPIGPKDAFVTGSTITNGRNLSYPAWEKSVLPNTKILYGERNIIFEKINPNKSSRISIDVTYDGATNYSCLAYIPRVPSQSLKSTLPQPVEPKPFNISGAWCRGGEPFVKWSISGTSLKQQRWRRPFGSNSFAWTVDPFILETNVQIVNNGAFKLNLINKGLVPDQPDKLEETYIIEDPNTVTFQRRMRATPLGWTPAQGINEQWPYQLKRCQG